MAWVNWRGSVHMTNIEAIWFDSMTSTSSSTSFACLRSSQTSKKTRRNIYQERISSMWSGNTMKDITSCIRCWFSGEEKLYILKKRSRACRKLSFPIVSGDIYVFKSVLIACDRIEKEFASRVENWQTSTSVIIFAITSFATPWHKIAWTSGSCSFLICDKKKWVVISSCKIYKPVAY